MMKCIAALLCFGFATAYAQDPNSGRELTAEEKAFELRTRKAVFDLIQGAHKSAFGGDYLVVDSEPALEANLGISFEMVKRPYCLMFELRYQLQPGTARYDKTQAEIQTLLTQVATLQTPEEAQAFTDVHDPEIALNPLISVYINDDAHIEFISFRRNQQKLTKPGARHVVRGDGSTSTALYFGHFGPLREEEDTTPGSRAFAATPQFDPKTPRLAVQSILIVLRAPHPYVDALYSKLDIAALQKLIVP